MEDFKAVKRRRLYQDIVGQIQGFIREGVLKPGDRLPAERELAERLQVSRSSLREAMRTLELQGLVISRPGAGTYVRAESLDALVSVIDLSLDKVKDSLKDIFEVRHLLEPQIAALAARRATRQDIERMRGAITEQEKQIGRGETGVEGDTAFHFAVAQATRNWALLIVISNVSDVLHQSRDDYLQTSGRPQRSLASHGEILEMILRGDSQGARSAMEHHLSQVEPGDMAEDGEPAPVDSEEEGMLSLKEQFERIFGE